MNQEQTKAAIRWIIATFGPFIISHGYASASTLEMVGGILVSTLPLILSMFAHTQNNAVAVVAEIAKDPASPVMGVITTSTPAGHALADSIPGPTVVPAGTPAAKTIAGAPA
jgi:hypothetical protein